MNSTRLIGGALLGAALFALAPLRPSAAGYLDSMPDTNACRVMREDIDPHMDSQQNRTDIEYLFNGTVSQGRNGDQCNIFRSQRNQLKNKPELSLSGISKYSRERVFAWGRLCLLDWCDMSGSEQPAPPSAPPEPEPAEYCYTADGAVVIDSGKTCHCPAGMRKAFRDEKIVSGRTVLEYLCRVEDNPAPPPAPPPPRLSNGTYTIRVCNTKGGGGAAQVAHLAYLVPTSENFWKRAWWLVAEGQCVNTLTVPFGTHDSRSFWTFAQFDKAPLFWPKQALDPVGRGLDQARWCLPLPPTAVTSEVVKGVSYPCDQDGGWNRFFEEQEVRRASEDNTVVTVNIAPILTEVQFKLSVCNESGTDDMWVIVGLPTAASTTQSFIRGWSRIPRQICTIWPGYHYPNHPGTAYVHAERDTPGAPPLIFKTGEGPVQFCVKQGHAEFNRVSDPGGQCAPGERKLDFYRIRLPHDFPLTVTTVHVARESWITEGE